MRFFGRRPGLALIAALAVVAILVVAFVLTGTLLTHRLDDPLLADREDLVRWLVVRDLAREPDGLLHVLAMRLDEEFFATEFDWGEVAGQLSEAQRWRLIENLVVLFDPWCRARAACFAAVEPEGREAFLDEMLDRIEVLAGAGKIVDPSPRGGMAGGTLTERMLASFEAITTPAEAVDAEADDVRQFLGALQRRWVTRQLQQWFGPRATAEGGS